jgi:hypothetical protein
MFPQSRIVCLTEETVETLYLLREQDRIVGISGYVVRPPQARRGKGRSREERGARRFGYRPEAPPIRPQRHVPNSIATVRRRLIVALAKTLPRCPCCNAEIRKIRKIPDY